MFGRRRIATVVAEFLGTGALTLLVLSVQRSTIGVPFFVALAAGVTLALMVFTIGNKSGGFFNPAITLGLWTARRVSTVNALLFVAAQLLGAWGAYYLYTYFVNNALQPVGGHFTGRILVAEAVGTGIFAFGVAAAVYRGVSSAVLASFAGVALMVGMVAASAASIGLLNPALALGARAWVWGTYVLGPVLGAVIGVNLYGLLFAESSNLVAEKVSTTVTPNKTTSKTTTVAKKGRSTVKKTKKTTTRKR
ncbi:MAG: major intrinsic protein [Candidatus Saccharibacteria bacterium]|nr:major intrinsic protein [Candidatus Saccharibacteria bacterium]